MNLALQNYFLFGVIDAFDELVEFLTNPQKLILIAKGTWYAVFQISGKSIGVLSMSTILIVIALAFVAWLILHIYISRDFWKPFFYKFRNRTM